MMRRKLRWALRLLCVALLIPGSFVGWRWGSGNFGAVFPGRIYRSAQPSAGFLEARIRRHGIKTVLNLRGANPDQTWYRGERDAALGAGATLVDFPMSSDQWLSREQARTLVEILDRAEPPILIHCEWGAERTGLVSALCQLLRDGSTLDAARREFSAYYLFLPMKDGLVMRGHLDRYAEWLQGQGIDHSPERLRRWLASDYKPGSPSREYWPCNPYPLKTVSRPSVESASLWGSNACPVTR